MNRMLPFLLTLALAAPLFAQTTVLIATGLARPLFVTHAPNDYDRIYILEQHEARVRVFNLTTNALVPGHFIDIDSLVVSTGNERGLLGMAFHPDFQNNRYFYLSYNDNSGTSVIARFTASNNPDSAIATSRFNILTQTQPFSNHNGGCIHFGSDGYLYIALGDGGSGEDPQNNGQTTSTLLGKILRIDVDNTDAGLNYAIPDDNPFVGVPGYRAEIWSLGWRNPWRWSFDRETGDMYIADVGQYTWEEVNVEAASDTGGGNYGWRCREAYACTGWGGCDCNNPALVYPVTAYNHDFGCSITGGYVYRGCAIPSLYGTYFYADYCSDDIWSFVWDGANGTTDSTNWTTALEPPLGSIANISSFGEDAYGELYICDLNGGEVFKVIPDNLIDCNSNNIADACDIESGNSLDIDLDGIPDECDDCFAVPASDLTIAIVGDTAKFAWEHVGGDTATYTLWQSPDSEANFPDDWNIVAQGLTSLDNMRVRYDLAPLSGLPDAYFYKVTTVCQ